MIDLVWLIPVFPLIGFLINGLLGRNFSEKAIGWIGALSVGASFVVALVNFSGASRECRLRNARSKR